MTVKPITLRAANAFVTAHHRHSAAVRGCSFCVSLVDDGGELIGVAIAGRPLARLLCDGVTIEILRVCTLGHRNAPSKLYSACCRAAKAIGYQRAVTYLLATELGTSAKAAGFAPVATSSGGVVGAQRARVRCAAAVVVRAGRPAPTGPRAESAMGARAMKIGSLFSGVGGLDLACERVFGGETIWQVEGIDLDLAWRCEPHPAQAGTWERLRGYARHGDFNRRILVRHWPRARQLCDVRTVGGGNLPPVDIICGGFPCQDLSVAGNGKGLEGRRSGLYRELLRIVGELMPARVVMENVPPLLKYRDTLAADFAELGYGLRWQPLAASNVGAPHRRKRVFVLATRGSSGSVVLDAPPLNKIVNYWPTPLGDGDRRTMFAQGGEPLGHAARWPTPTARDGRSGAGTGIDRGHTPQLPELLGGNLNPAWVELLMGLPSGWTEDPKPQGDLFRARPSRMEWPGSHQWPAARGLPQRDHEPPRLVPSRSLVDRGLRLRSLGNGVVPQQAIAALASMLAKTDTAPEP